MNTPAAAPALRNVQSLAPAVTRAAALLDLLSQPNVGALGLSDFARQLDLPKSSIANLCSALEDVGLLRRVNGGYLLGHRLLEFGSAYLRSIDQLQDFHETSRSLPVASQETLLLATLDGTDVLYLARHDGAQPIRLASDVGRRMPSTCTALGKAMLAQLEPAALEGRLANLWPFPVLSPNSKRNLRELVEDLELTRERGYAIDDEENTLGVTCFAVALTSSTPEHPRSAVSVTLLKARYSDELRDQLVDDLRHLAAHLSLRVSLGRGEPS